MNQYMYVLKLIPRLLIASKWTEHDEDIVSRHFAHLKALLEDKKLILAGKTEGLDEKTFGIVIFEANHLDEAKKLMNQDPAIKEGIMSGELFPYRVALMR